MMALTFCDVTGRYLLNRPVRGGQEVTELAMLILIFAGLPLVAHADEHVTMDFIDRLLPPRLLGAWIRIMHVVCAAIMFFLAWQIWIKAAYTAGVGDYTDVVHILYAPFIYFMSATTVLAGLVHVYKAFVPGERRTTQATT
jgi:TRAP-type C4-dicarboxylate transport system permease small subunit